VKRYSLAELALLVIFVIGLLLAWVVVQKRSRIVLTEPIELKGLGLSVCLPGGAGWEYTPAWTYENENGMVLAAQRRVAANAAVKMTWRLEFCSVPAGLDEILAKRLLGFEAKVEPLEMPEKTGMQAARVIASEGLYDAVYLVARKNLDFGRAIELQVMPSDPDMDSFYLEDLLREVASSVVYAAPESVGAGVEVLNRFFSTINADMVSDEAFLITDRRGRTTGFYTADKRVAGDGNVEVTSRHYDAQQFRIDSKLAIGRLADPFEWDTNVTLPSSSAQAYQIRRNEDGGLKVTGTAGQEKHIACAEQHLLPEILLTDFAGLFVESSQGDVTVDVLSATGMVVPVLIERISTEDASARSDEVGSAVRVTYLHGSGFFDELYYNKDSALIGRFERQPRRQDRLWDRSTDDELRHVFGQLVEVR